MTSGGEGDDSAVGEVVVDSGATGSGVVVESASASRRFRGYIVLILIFFCFYDIINYFLPFYDIINYFLPFYDIINNFLPFYGIINYFYLLFWFWFYFFIRFFVNFFHLFIGWHGSDILGFSVRVATISSRFIRLL
jgi:hypothetical protein